MPMHTLLRLRIVSVFLAVAVALLSAGSSALAQGTGYWHTQGSQIVDASGEPVRIAGINWYGFETTDEVAHGLSNQDYHAILNTIQQLGYNTIRLPFSNQMVESPIIPSDIAYSNSAGPINTDLKGLNSQQIMDKIVSAAGARSLKVILDNHRSEAGNSAEASGLWYTGSYPESAWISDWKALVTRYANYRDAKGDPIVIGVDLRNEPHNATSGGACWTGDSSVGGCPTTNAAQNWPAAAERAGNAILAINPGLLIFVEGTDEFNNDWDFWGGNLEGAGNYPVKLNLTNRVVYSAHDYGPTEYKQSWFNSNTTAASLDAVWTKFWAYLSINGQAPVWVGEFGTTNNSSDVESNTPGSEGQWFSSLVSFLANHPAIDWTYWALNGEDNYALLDANYDATPVSSLKQQSLSSIQFKLNEGGGSASCTTAPGSPTALSATASSSSQLKLSWSAVTPPSGCSVTYSIYRSTASGFTASSSNRIASGLSAASFEDTGLKSSTTYYYRVSAADSAGASAASSQASAKTSAAASSGFSCHVAYSIVSQWNSGFQASLTIANTSSAPISTWVLQWRFPNQQQLTSIWNASSTQSGESVTLTNASYNGSIPAGGNYGGVGFTASYSGTNGAPVAFTVNGAACN